MSLLVLVFIQQVAICIFRYNTITVYYFDRQANFELPSQPRHCWTFPCRMSSFRSSPLGVHIAFQAWFRQSGKKALTLHTPISDWSKGSTKHLFGTQLDNAKSFAESHIRVQPISLQIGVFMLLWHLQYLFPPFPLIPATIQRANETVFVVYRYLVLFFL